MKKINKISVAKKVLKAEATSLIKITSKLNASFDKACDLILNCKGKVVTIGLGKSGHVAAKSSATLSSTGTPSIFKAKVGPPKNARNSRSFFVVAYMAVGRLWIAQN